MHGHGLCAATSQLLTQSYSCLLQPSWCSTGSAGGPQAAKDALGNDVRAAAWLAAHPAGDRSLVQGLQGDATYLVVTDGDGIQDFGINSICTHLG